MIVIVRKTNNYMRPTGPVFVYSVKSDAAKEADQKKELDEYEKTLAENYRTSDNGEPLFFARQPLEEGQQLAKTQKGRYIVAQDLEKVATEALKKSQEWEAKFKGLQSAMGLTPEEIVKMVMGA